MAGHRRVKIRFFAALKKRVDDPAWPGGNIPMDWIRNGAPQMFDRSKGEIAKADAPGLANLTYGKEGTAYVRDPSTNENDPDPDYNFAELVMEKADVMHLRFWRVRRSQLPSIHDLADGSTVPLGLQDTQGLVEAVDVVLFPVACVVGVLLNRAGPSRASILAYLEQQTAVAIKFAALSRDDALDIINGDRVTAVDVEVAAGHFEALANLTEEIGEAAKEVDTPGLRTMRISLSAVRDERGNFWQWWLPRARNLLGLPRKKVTKLDVSQAASGELVAHVVDLLEEQIGLEVSVPIETGRTVEADEGRNAVINGFETYNDLIKRASDGLDAHAENQRTERKRAPTKRVSQDSDTVDS